MKSKEKTSINFDQMDTSKNNNYLQTVAKNKIFDWSRIIKILLIAKKKLLLAIIENSII